MTTTDFKPCPFCGGTDHLFPTKRQGTHSLVDWVKCLDCLASAPAYIWRQRSPMAEVQEIMEEVKK